MFKEQTYEGFSNRTTWNVALWIDNEYRWYKAKLKFCLTHGASNLTEANVAEFCRDLIGPSGTEDFESSEDWNKVVWKDIVEHWRAEGDEQA